MAILEFKFGFDRVLIKIPEEIVDEVRRICKPLDANGSFSFVFDFLTCRLGNEYVVGDEPNVRHITAFSWVEVKSGTSLLSRHQEETARTCKIQFNVFRVKDVMVAPDNVWITCEGQGID